MSLLHMHSHMHSAEQPVVLMIGTRPEAIKVFPVYMALKKSRVPVLLCSTGQHGYMLDEMYRSFHIYPDVDFRIMKPGQDLLYITQETLQKCTELFRSLKPSLVVVQGDTTTAMASSVAAFYLHIPVAHIEAGLRTGNIVSPFPEEWNRRCISLIASLHFAPTKSAEKQLLSEGVAPASIICSGNTVVDAVRLIKEKIDRAEIEPSSFVQKVVSDISAAGQRALLLTTHRRESIPDGTRSILLAARAVLDQNPGVHIIFPMHPNPAIRQIAHDAGLFGHPQITITDPLSYYDLIYVMSRSFAVLTDSGGIQEEAVSLCKPVLILRNETDRPEGLNPGRVELVGTDSDTIIDAVHRILSADSVDSNEGLFGVYGDGYAAEKIAGVISQFLQQAEVL